VVGLAFLIVPFLFGASPMMSVVAGGLRFPGWMLLSAGVVMLGIVYARKSSNSVSPPASQGVPPAKARALTDRDKRELVENIFRHAPAKATHPADTQFRREPVMSPGTPFGGKADNSAEPLPTQPTEWSPAVFAAIEWRRFEAVCEALFGQAGFETRSQTHGADGGVDIWLHSRHAEGPVAVVQCKHWRGKAVGVREMREFYGVMTSNQLKRGTYATTSTYTADAMQFAKDNGINALNGNALLAQIASRTPAQQQALLAVAFEGEYWRPTCASCGIKLLERTPAKGGAPFWGCSNYPRCSTRIPMTLDAR
jgi:restriction system protein